MVKKTDKITFIGLLVTLLIVLILIVAKVIYNIT